MGWMKRWRRDRERDLERELRDHLELEAEDRGGNFQAAHRALGNRRLIREDTRAEWPGATLVMMMSDIRDDIRYSARRLSRSPGFTSAAVLTLAVGIGLTTGTFSLFNALFARDLPVPDAQDLVSVSRVFEGRETLPDPSFTFEEYLTLNDRTATLSGLVAHSTVRDLILGEERPQGIRGVSVSCNYFRVLRQPPALGRGFSGEDCETGATPVVILGHSIWESVFAQDPEILGSAISLYTFDGASRDWIPRAFTVVGIAQADSYGPSLERPEYFVPYPTLPETMFRIGPDGSLVEFGSLELIGRRREGARLAEIRSELRVIAADLDPGMGELRGVEVERATPLPIRAPGLLTIGLLFMAPFGLVMLIVCANVANLLLARATERSREVAMRLSLGAGRSRIARQFLTESALVGVLGGALGSIVAFATFDRLVAFIISSIPDPSASQAVVDLTLDVRVLLFAVSVSLGAGLVCGIAPALKASRPDLNTAMKPDAPTLGHPPGGKLQGILIGVQVAVCMVLVAATGLFLRSLHQAYTFDPGVEYQDVASVSVIRIGRGATADAVSFQGLVEDRIAGLPGVDKVAYTSSVPWTTMAGQPISSTFYVSPGYFSLLGIPIVQGRAFTEEETTGSSTSVIVSQSTAERLWPGQEPIGQILESLLIGARQGVAVVGRPGLVPLGDVPPTEQGPFQVVGVAGNAKLSSVWQDDPYVVYAPLRAGSGTLLVKADMGASSIASIIRTALAGLDSGLLIQVASLDENLGAVRYMSRFMSMLAASVGGLALLLAVIGIYSVVACVVTRRRHEIGIRLALGASSGHILKAILGRTMRPVVAGIVLGLGGVALTIRLLSRLGLGLDSFDPVWVGGAAVAVLVVAFAASVLPVERGLHSDPLTTLRQD